MKQASKEKLRDDRNKTEFIHLRVDPAFKRDVENYAKEHNTSVTAVVTRAIEKMLYESETEKKAQEIAFEEITEALENLERRLELRITLLQDNIQSLMNALLSSDVLLAKRPKKAKSKRRTKREEQEEFEEEYEEEEFVPAIEEIMVINEQTIYDKVLDFVRNEGRVVTVDEVKDYLEKTCKKCIEFLQKEEAKQEGMMQFYLVDAIQEALTELGINM